MELEGVVQNGVIVPDDASTVSEGARVRFELISDKPKTFGERYKRFVGAIPDLPTDLADQHEHYRLGTPKR